MTAITANSDMSKLLSDVHAPTPIIDERGNRLGTFLPEIPDQESLLKRIAKPFDADAARERLKHERNKCVSSEAVLNRLKSMGNKDDLHRGVDSSR